VRLKLGINYIPEMATRMLRAFVSIDPPRKYPKVSEIVNVFGIKSFFLKDGAYYAKGSYFTRAPALLAPAGCERRAAHHRPSRPHREPPPLATPDIQKAVISWREATADA